ncbi:MAG: pyridoxal phosphate-dependent aminotransferase family protein [Verrucomicrobia bacterium]|nr:pyridoxal phosphate-dependent aminotransferase family protein [Verrucomicrobiota bacterium]MBI3870696.1 pyridoxal phosphate-dependent aminotransferase family protein [Verrucomicrobiota bacterium]
MSAARSSNPCLMESAPGPEIVVDGVRYLYFGGTSYLGLHAHPGVIEAGCDALRRFGVHSATSRQGFGNTPLLMDVERSAAAFFGMESAFYFSSGYAANHIAVQALASGADKVFVDAEAHYCVQEAACLARKPVLTFKHRDAADLRAMLTKGERALVLSDGVTPANGHIAPVRDYIDVLRDFSPSTLHLDDAHGVGVLGPYGRGVFEECGLWEHVNGGPPFQNVALSVCATLAKALGGFGGIIPGAAEFVERTRRHSHYFDGASAPASPVAGCSLEALAICRREPERRDRLRRNVQRLRAGLRALGAPATDEPTPNVGVVLGDAGSMRRAHEELRARGILAPYVPSYSGTGPEGLIRIAVCSEHSFEMIDRLLAALREILHP